MKFASFGNKKTYADFERQIPADSKPVFEEIREFCLSLGDKVVEDIRMHRIVFGKSMTFRWFADIEPESSGVLIKIQRDRKEPPETVQVRSKQDIVQIKKAIKEAFEKIH